MAKMQTGHKAKKEEKAPARLNVDELDAVVGAVPMVETKVVKRKARESLKQKHEREMEAIEEKHAAEMCQKDKELAEIKTGRDRLMREVKFRLIANLARKAENSEKEEAEVLEHLVRYIQTVDTPELLLIVLASQRPRSHEARRFFR